MAIPRARNTLVANREQQPRYRQRRGVESFGVYGALTEETRTRLGSALLNAQREASKYTYWKDGVRFTVPPDIGITFVTRRAISHAMWNGAIERGFSRAQFRQRAEATPQLRIDPVELPLGGIDWRGVAERKVAASLTGSAEHLGVLRRADMIVALLGEAGADIPDDELSDPEHVTLLHYGTRRDFEAPGQRRRNRLTENQRDDLAEIVQKHLDVHEIGSIVLEGITVGRTYTGEPEDRLFAVG